MDESTLNRPRLECPTCNYDLRGLTSDADGVFRCPECGGLTDIMSMVLVQQRRREQARNIWFGLTLIIAIFAVVTFTPTSWIMLNATLIVPLGAVFMATLFYVRRLGDFSWRFTIGTSVALSLLMTLPRAMKPESACWVFPLTFTAVVLLHFWAADRELKRWSG